MKVSCIIPFWNEATRIKKVLTALKDVSLIQEILLIDDGSTDGGIQSEEERIQLFRFEQNQGKSAAMRFGFWKASGDIILFLDADLKGITAAHIEALLLPIIRQECRFTMALREHFLFFDVVSGERAMLRKDWEIFFKKESFSRNAMEIGMNRHLLLKDISMQVVLWEEVRQVYKSSKIGFIKGMKKDFAHVLDWMRQLGIFNFSCTYLLYWYLIYKKEGIILEASKKLYQKMFKSELS